MCEGFGMIWCSFLPKLLVMLIGWLFQMVWQCMSTDKLQIISHNIRITSVFCILSRNKIMHWVVSWMNHRVKNTISLFLEIFLEMLLVWFLVGFFLWIVIIRLIITNWQIQVLKSESRYFGGKNSINKKKAKRAV